jgi:hypothetical protein
MVEINYIYKSKQDTKLITPSFSYTRRRYFSRQNLFIDQVCKRLCIKAHGANHWC